MSFDRRQPRMMAPNPGGSPRLRADEVEVLISRARLHPLGLDFLRHGALESVAAVFHTHAFVIDQARDRLAGS